MLAGLAGSVAAAAVAVLDLAFVEITVHTSLGLKSGSNGTDLHPSNPFCCFLRTRSFWLAMIGR
jgi:hypothetical protein